MITCKPITIRTSELTSSTVPYPDTGETVWATGQSYNIGDSRSYEVNGLIHKFTCIQAHTSSSGNSPKPYPDENAYWFDQGAVNRYRMFHLERNLQTVASSPYVVEITPGERFGLVALSRVVADDVRIEVYDGATQIYDETHEMIGREVLGWHDWLFQPFRQIENMIAIDLPILGTAKLKLTFTKATGSIKVGPTVIGMPFDIGDTQLKARAVDLNFSTVERDTFGDVKVTIRRSIPRTEQSIQVDVARVSQVKNLLNELNGVVTCWAGVSDPVQGYFDSLFIIGFYREKEFRLDFNSLAYLDLKIEGI